MTGPGYTGKGRQGVLDFWSLYMESFPDNRVVARTILMEGEVAVEEARFEGTHTGPLRTPDGGEIPPTGRQVSIGFVGIHTARNGKVSSSRFYFDQVELLTNLGLMPT